MRNEGFRTKITKNIDPPNFSFFLGGGALYRGEVILRVFLFQAV